MDIQSRIRIQHVQVLSQDWGLLKKTTFDWLRRDGRWQTMSRETYDRGNAAVLLPYDLQRGCVLLTRQFRYPTHVNAGPGLMIEAPAGLLDSAAPEERIRLEVEEETGYRLGEVRPVMEAFMSPGSVTEKLYFFVAPYTPAMRLGEGGGLEEEGEDIELLELPLDEALDMVRDGRIQDAKTIMLLQYAALNLFRGNAVQDRPRAPAATARPWGHYLVLAETETYKVKAIVVQPGHRLSLQRHRQRQEHWFVQEGVARVEVDGQARNLGPGEAVDIPALSWHRMANETAAPLTILEIQTGGYFGEDDIERAGDDYGRAG